MALITSCYYSTGKNKVVINAADYGLKEGVDGTPAIIRALEVAKEKSASKQDDIIARTLEHKSRTK